MTSTNTITTMRDTTTTSSTTSTSSVVLVLRARARAREEEQREMAAATAAAADYWRICIGRELPPVGRQRMGQALAHGMEPELLCDIIDQTAGAPRPSWAYCAAIMDRIEREGIKTEAEYQAAQARRRAAQRPDMGKFGRNSGQSAQNYEQRQYDNAKLAYLYEDN